MEANLDLFFHSDCDFMVRLDIQNNLFYLASLEEISVYQLTNELLSILSAGYTLTTKEEFELFSQNVPIGYVSNTIVIDRNIPLSLLFSRNQFASC
jgi:hypothetical protein